MKLSDNFEKGYKMPVGTELHVPSSSRKGWKLVQYVTDDMICIEASDGKQIQTHIKNVVLLKSANINRTSK